MAEFFYCKNEVLISKSKNIQISFIFESGEAKLNFDFFFPVLCPKLLTEFLLNNSILSLG